MAYTKILIINMILIILMEMAYINILKLNMILLVLIEMGYIKILKMNMILMVMIKNGVNKYTNTFLNRKNFVRDDIYNNISWLTNKNEFLKLYGE